MISLGQLFGQPDKQHWTPEEIVQKTCTLEGIAGAVIALHDGLPVAGDLPQHVSGETLAAFLPQIFGRMSQYANEVGLGEPGQVSLLANQVPLQIARAGKVYFAVLGRANQPLPTTPLHVISCELARQSR